MACKLTYLEKSGKYCIPRDHFLEIDESNDTCGDVLRKAELAWQEITDGAPEGKFFYPKVVLFPIGKKHSTLCVHDHLDQYPLAARDGGVDFGGEPVHNPDLTAEGQV